MEYQLAIIIPTLNERDNLRPLLAELSRVLADWRWQVVFVDDDSTDGTREEVRRIMRADDRVQLLHRIGRRGLSSACLEGMAATDSTYLLVMDADQQHDPAIIPQMLRAAEAGECDVVVGTRFSGAGHVGGLSPARERGSRLTNRLLRRFAQADLSDPLSGFFLLPRTVYRETRYQVSGSGFKLLLDMLLSSPRPLRVREVPFEFRQRQSGESKLDVSIVGEFVALLVEKASGGRVPGRFFMFLCAGSVGAVFHFAALVLAHRGLEWSFPVAHLMATYTAITVNFAVNNLFTYRDQRLRGAAVLRGWAVFALVCSMGALNSLVVAQATRGWGLAWLPASFAGAVYGSVWNYFMSGILVWFRSRRRPV